MCVWPGLRYTVAVTEEMPPTENEPEVSVDDEPPADSISEPPPYEAPEDELQAPEPPVDEVQDFEPPVDEVQAIEPPVDEVQVTENGEQEEFTQRSEVVESLETPPPEGKFRLDTGFKRRMFCQAFCIPSCTLLFSVVA